MENTTITESVEVPAAVKQAIENYVPPPGFMLKPPPESNPSILYQWGVRLRKVVDGKDDEFGFACLDDATCRGEERFIPLSKGMTSKGTNHLKSKHFVTGERS